MKKFSELNEESKYFMPDPSIVKKYASFIIPFYLNGVLKVDDSLIDEYLEMNKKQNREKNTNIVCGLEIIAVKLLIDNPLTQTGYENLEKEINNKCPKLEKYLRLFVIDPKNFL